MKGLMSLAVAFAAFAWASTVVGERALERGLSNNDFYEKAPVTRGP